MKNYQILVLFGILTICFIACTKENNNAQQKEAILFTLLSPLETIEPIKGVIFEWDSDHESVPTLEVGRTSDFDDLVLDTTLEISSSSFVLNEKLYPNSKYFWRVRFDSLAKESFFYTENLLASYEGIHNLKVRERYWWDSGGVQSDTTYYSDFEFVVIEEKLQIPEILDDNGQPVSLIFNLSNNTHNILDYEYWNSHHIMFSKIFVDLDSVYMYRENGSLGAWTTWNYSGVIE